MLRFDRVHMAPMPTFSTEKASTKTGTRWELGWGDPCTLVKVLRVA